MTTDRCSYCDRQITGCSPEEYVYMDRMPDVFKVIESSSLDPIDHAKMYRSHRHYVCRPCYEDLIRHERQVKGT